MKYLCGHGRLQKPFAGQNTAQHAVCRHRIASESGAHSREYKYISCRVLPIETLLISSLDFRRYALSTLVNTLLKPERTVPFEFLIHGQFLRTSLDEYLTTNGISAETTLAVEYVRAIIPPLYIASFEHDDWISSVDIIPPREESSKIEAGGENILTGSYDGTLKVWSTSSEVICSSPSPERGGHQAAVKAVKHVNPNQIASAGMDRTIRIWRFSRDEGKNVALAPKLELYGHKASVDSIAAHDASQRVLSGSADHTIGLWSTKKSDAPAAPSALLPSAKMHAKRRKTNTSASTAQRGSLSTLKSHNGPVSSVTFAPNDPTVAHSTSWDHSLKIWDLPTSTCVDTRSTSHSLLSLEPLPNLNLIATGTSARHITLIDPRASAVTISAMTLRGHTNAVVSLASDPTSPYGLLSGSHDGTCRVWDVRSSKSEKEGRVGESVYCIDRESAKGGRRTAGEGIKVFDVKWDKDIGIVSVGEDKRVQINRGGS